MISSCRCDPQLDTEMTAARAHACLLTARDDAVLCSTPCFSCSAVLLFVPIFASRLSARECESKSVARSPARSRNAKPAVLRKSLLVVFAVKTFFFSPLRARRRLQKFWGGRGGPRRRVYCTGICRKGRPMLVPVGTRLCPAGAPCCAAGGKFSSWSQEEVDLVVSEGVWAKI